MNPSSASKFPPASNNNNNNNNLSIPYNNNFSTKDKISFFPSGNRVVNIYIFSFDPPVYSVLEKDLNFALAPTKILVQDIICDIEFRITDLSKISSCRTVQIT